MTLKEINSVKQLKEYVDSLPEEEAAQFMEICQEVVTEADITCSCEEP